ncbi:AAA family ATPase [Yoonia vestfoldensis]|uniref:AAA family ATPase n=1 Tax=Yoonia vestfoldensis TaxID=245188 RepID=UPI00036F075A|nr:AAA family ATPase [Yoonia vestfoldensis]
MNEETTGIALTMLTRHVLDLADHLLELDAPRVIVAIAGAPGSGKSTFAGELARRLNARGRRSVVVPMDGFHLDNAVLEARTLLPRKGAPETFDAHGFIRLIKAIKAGEEVFAPTFDRTRDLSIAAAIAIPADARVVIAEGNYLMFDEAPWSELAALWDVSVRLDVPMPELRARLIQRWLSQNLSRAVATRRAEGNDIPNAQRVIAKALPCDFTFDGQPARA